MASQITLTSGISQETIGLQLTSCSSTSVVHTNTADATPLNVACGDGQTFAVGTAAGYDPVTGLLALDLGARAKESGNASLLSDSSVATSTYADMVTPTGGVIGSAGTLTLDITTAGLITCSSPCNGAALTATGSLRLGAVGAQVAQTRNLTSGGSQVIAFTVPIVYGTPFALNLRLSALADTELSNGTIDTDWFNTATLTGLSFFDSTGLPVAGNLISDTGAPFSAPVPEPASIVLLAGGLGAVSARLAGRRSRRG